MEERAIGRRKKNNQQGEAIAKMIMEQYKPGSREEAQEAIKDIFGSIFEAMLQGEMEEHLGYVSNDHGSKETDNRRNGYIDKNVRTSYGEISVSVLHGIEMAAFSRRSSPNAAGMSAVLRIRFWHTWTESFPRCPD